MKTAIIIGLLLGILVVQIREYYDKREITKLEIEKLELEIQLKKNQLEKIKSEQ